MVSLSFRLRCLAIDIAFVLASSLEQEVTAVGDDNSALAPHHEKNEQGKVAHNATPNQPTKGARTYDVCKIFGLLTHFLPRPHLVLIYEYRILATSFTMSAI